jgi:hypothetical protein
LVLIVLIGFAAVAAAPRAAAAAPSCTVNWTGLGDGSSWSDPANWDTDAAPTSADTVCIAAGATATIDSQVTVAGLVLDGGTVDAASPLETGTLSAADGSAVDGPGPVTVDDDLEITGGSVDVGPGADLVTEGTAALAASSALCVTTGAILENAGALELGQGADLGDDDSPSCGGGIAAGEIVNDGGATITAAHGGSLAPASFDDDGELDVTGGTLSLPSADGDGPDDSGTWDISAGAILALAGNGRTFGDGETIIGAGTLEVSRGATAELEGGADLSGLGTLRVDAGATLLADDAVSGPQTLFDLGELAGPGPLFVDTGSTLSFSGDSTSVDQGLDLVSGGTTSVLNFAKVCIGSDSALENDATLTLGASANLGQGAVAGCGGTLLNEGTLDVIGHSILSPGQLTSDGPLNVASGPLTLDGAATVTGTLSGAAGIAVQPGATLELTPQASGSLGSLSVAAGATLTLDADQTTATSGPAAVAITGQAALSGTVLADGSALEPTGPITLHLLDYGSETGTPATQSDPAGWPITVGATALTLAASPTPPQNLAPPTVSGRPVVGATLTETAGSWTGNPTSVSDQWEDCDLGSGGCTPIGGAIGATYTVTADDVGEAIEVVETAGNGAGTGAPASSDPTDPVTSLTPQDLAAPAIDGDGIVGEPMTEIPGQWSNSPTSVSLQWMDCDFTGLTCTPIPGATGPTYTPTDTDVDASIVVQEIATNANGSGQPALSDPTDPVIDLSEDGDPSFDDPGEDPIPEPPGTGGHRATASVPSHRVSGSQLPVTVGCPGAAACPVKLTLTASLPASGSNTGSGHHGAKAHLSRAVVVGRTSTTLPAGASRTVQISLDKAGVSALAAQHSLRAVLTVAAGGTNVRTTTVSFTAATAAHGHRGARPAHHHRAKADGTKAHGGHRGAKHRRGGSGTRHGSG